MQRTRSTRKCHSPEQKRATVEVFQQSGRAQVGFAALWVVSAARLAELERSAAVLGRLTDK